MNAVNLLSSDVLVLGDSLSAHKIVSNLHVHQLSVVQIMSHAGSEETPSSDLPTIQTLVHTELKRASGSPGDFLVRLENNTRLTDLKTKQIVIAEDAVRKPGFKDYGLRPAANVIALSEYSEPASGSKHGRIVFLVGLVKESNPVITKITMEAALRAITAHQDTVYILTRNLKVADQGLEALYRDTKVAGVTYIKFTDTVPIFDQSENDTVTINFEDEYTREPFQLSPDLLVVDETIHPPLYLSAMADVFKLHVDAMGFLQKENVHRVGVLTNRRGIYAVGPARGVASAAQQMTDADDASLIIAQHLDGCERQGLQTAEINPNQCVRCLTCFRLCPYEAIALDPKPNVLSSACEGCGLCRAECPRQAIALGSFDLEKLANQASRGLKHEPAASDTPHMVAFCCSRSAAQASQMAICMGWEAPPGLKVIEVPCSGGISIRHILSAFEMGADGVLVLACHTDNCHSEYGNQYACARVRQLQGLLKSIDQNAKRLAFHTLASNMGSEFARIINEFEAELKG